MDSLPERFALEMRRRREALGLSQEELGAKIGMDRTAVSRIERKKPNLSLDNADAIATALGTNLPAMLSEEAMGGLATGGRRVFATRVRELRIDRNLNQRQLGEIAGVDRNWVSSVESGNANITLKTVEKFALAYQVLPIVLLTPDNVN
jgi:transcriptional regulator with XRE-family HTH domain